MTGAPKVRAMEIIKELEPINRGIYSGAIGYLSLDRSVDLNIVIRTIVVREGKAYFNVGGGIVYDSDPEAEYQESLDKASALIRAVTCASCLSDSTAKRAPLLAATNLCSCQEVCHASG